MVTVNRPAHLIAETALKHIWCWMSVLHELCHQTSADILAFAEDLQLLKYKIISIEYNKMSKPIGWGEQQFESVVRFLVRNESNIFE
jgi:hypothetical protein